jgi:transaldolase / glucose-6-phosphate isomerase
VDAGAGGRVQPGAASIPDDVTVQRLGVLAGPVMEQEVRARLDHARLRAHDTALWPAPSEVTAPWLGWLESLDRAPGHLRRIEPLVAEIVADGITDVVLTGMGGSSLFPMVLERICGRQDGHPRMHVIDSTDPAAVARIEREVDWQHAVVVAASKSGTTVETRAHLDYFVDRLTRAVGDRAAGRVVVITDPGSELESIAHGQLFRTVVPGDADVGGRYSALSPFGLLPAALLGIDLVRLLTVARTSDLRWREDPWSDSGPAMLATFLACGFASGRDVLQLLVPDGAGAVGAWVEQLVAESSGKDGRGVIPIVREGEDAAARAWPAERTVVVSFGVTAELADLVDRGVPVLVVPWDGPEGLAREALRWMHAVPLLCAQLGVDPFDQPDVALAKAATATALAQGTEPEESVTVASLLEDGAPVGYVALLAYVDPDGPMVARLTSAADRIAQRAACPVTVGVGPRYLHSTGQLHKGGRSDGLFLIVVGDDPADVSIPGRPYGFARLKRAQAAGDLAALRSLGRRVARVDPDDPDLMG